MKIFSLIKGILFIYAESFANFPCLISLRLLMNLSKLFYYKFGIQVIATKERSRFFSRNIRRLKNLTKIKDE